MLRWGATRHFSIEVIGRRVTRRSYAASSSQESTQRARPSSAGKHISRREQYQALPSDWKAVIGVEVHAQLKSNKKLFSSAPSDGMLASSSAAENSLVAPFDAALPGALPTLQMEPFQLALRACLALKCEIAEWTSFDRKHYFYPDLTSGYQISQKYAPLARNGSIRLLHDDGFLGSASDEVNVKIEQIQLEQDTAKSTHHINHSTSSTLIDLNRAGSALVEIVSGPDMHTAEQAGAYVRKLRETLRRYGVSDGNMDQGSLRCDVNVSVHRIGEPWGVRCEVKNLNSIRFVMNAIGSEMNRQYKLLSSGEAVTQETRGYDEALGTTYSLRSKEDAPDYRFMPDPNLPPLQVTPELIESVKKDLPESLEEQRKRLVEQYQLPLRDVNVLMRIGLEDEKIVNADAVAYFEQLAKGRDAKVALNWVTQVLLRNLNSQELSFADNSVEASHLGNLIDLVEGGQCTSTTGSSLVKEMLRDARLLEPYASSTNPVLALLVDRDALALDSNEELTALCQQVIQDLPKESEKIRKGQEKVLARLIGEVMKRTKGRADAEVARTELMRLLKT